ncbi:MAG TPA: FAD-dependent oxidoreductase, partial [Verrucomicrobiales bacterium]|nr:FAD-dependent oxidoreductase [Verrucomicrobiales bacterium]
MKLTIDNHELETDEPLTIFQAAEKVGIKVPVMCYKEGYDYFTSCMICMVKDQKTGMTHPACSAKIADGMQIETNCDEIQEHRKFTLELLLSEHVGDCEAPCQRLCAVHSEVPRMIREIKDNQMEDAIATIRKDMAIPSILERFCNAPCEKGCRRSIHDEGVSIRHLSRYTSDWDLKRENPYVPPRAPLTDKKIAIVGSGVSGLSLAYYLALLGHACTVFEKSELIGGRLNSAYDETQLPKWVKEGEINLLRKLGVEFKINVCIGLDLSMEQVVEQYDAIALTCGEVDAATIESFGVTGT